MVLFFIFGLDSGLSYLPSKDWLSFEWSDPFIILSSNLSKLQELDLKHVSGTFLNNPTVITIVKHLKTSKHTVCVKFHSRAHFSGFRISKVPIQDQHVDLNKSSLAATNTDIIGFRST